MTTDLINFLNEELNNVRPLHCREHNQDDSSRKREAYARDYSRVIYANSVRRQQGKMQLFSVNGRAFHRNRLTHSFEVAQIASGIVSHLRQKIIDCSIKQIDKDFRDMEIVVETAALIHDVGNPPFGHHGERILNELSKGIGFEGNAQGIRIIRRLEKKNPNYSGLNLTYRTMAAILKYNVKYNSKAKKFIYKEDFDHFESKFSKLNIRLRTIDVQIVDLADEIAYCGHDLEDALASRYFTIDEFLMILKKNLKDETLYNTFKGWVDDAKKYASEVKYEDDYDFYFRRELLSIIVHKLINDIGVVAIDDEFKRKTGSQKEEELGLQEYKRLASAIKKAIFIGVTTSDDIILYENVATKVLTKLFYLFLNEEYNREGLLMPVEYRFISTDSETDKIRKVLDYISGMMDTYAIQVYEKHFGESPFLEKYNDEVFTHNLGRLNLNCQIKLDFFK